MFSPVAADHIQKPRNQGPPEHYTQYGVAGEPGNGPYAEMWITVEEGIIRSASYRTPGCPSSVAASSVLCEISRGREVANMRTITSSDLLTILGGLPEGKAHAAVLAVDAFKKALVGEKP